MPAIFDMLYREYCRARLAEMRKQLLISPEKHKVPESLSEIKDAVGTDEENQGSGGGGRKARAAVPLGQDRQARDAAHPKDGIAHGNDG